MIGPASQMPAGDDRAIVSCCFLCRKEHMAPPATKRSASIRLGGPNAWILARSAGRPERLTATRRAKFETAPWRLELAGLSQSAPFGDGLGQWSGQSDAAPADGSGSTPRIRL